VSLTLNDTAKQTLIQRSRRVPPAEKAAFHQITGAGRSHVKREFFGLSPKDEDTVIERFAQGLDRLLQQAEQRGR